MLLLLQHRKLAPTSNLFLRLLDRQTEEVSLLVDFMFRHKIFDTRFHISGTLSARNGSNQHNG